MRTRCHFLHFVLVCLAMCPFSPAWADDGDNAYRLGRGYAVGDTGLRLGGYAAIQTALPQHRAWSFEVNDLSLFLTWDNGGRFHFFSELEAGDLLSAGEHQSLGVQNVHFEFERCYLDTLINNYLSVRLGKYLSPVGQWNSIHAAPLVWTSSRPVATENLFSTHGTGLMLYGSATFAQHLLEYSIYGDASNSLDVHRSENPFENAAGGHIRYFVSDALQIGASYANFTLNEHAPARSHLAGLDLAWRYHRYELSSELVYRNSQHASKPHTWQGFVQSAIPLTQQWYAISRYEFFQQQQDRTGQVGLLGLAYRPIPPLTWKLEYRLGSHNSALAADGFTASFAILF